MLAVVFVLSAFVPLAVMAASHPDDRCCANGICCCRPKPVPAGGGVRAGCACAGHDEHEAGLPAYRPFVVSPRYRLPLAATARVTPAPAPSRVLAGHLRLFDHPPDRRALAAC